MKSIEKLETINILQVNTEMQLIVYAVEDLMYLTKLL